MNTTAHLRKLGSALCLIAGLAAFGSGFAQDQGDIQIETAAYKEVEVKAEDGTASTKLLPVDRVVPGDVVVYEIRYANSGEKPATDVAVNNPVPAEVAFVEAVDPPTVVSVDKGKHFAALADLRVQAADGSSRPAQPSDVTNLRWTIATLSPGGSGKIVYRVKVK